jgi:hypothetical protein
MRGGAGVGGVTEREHDRSITRSGGAGIVTTRVARRRRPFDAPFLVARWRAPTARRATIRAEVAWGVAGLAVVSW